MDTELVLRAEKIVGREAQALDYANVYAPILDLERDSHEGCVLECYSEDSFLVTAFGKAMVNGIQFQNEGASLKYYAVYSVPKGSRKDFGLNFLV